MSNEIKGTYDIDAIEYIARLADGGLRDSLSLLDKCLAYSTELTLENVIKALGVVNYDVFFDLTDAIVNKNSTSIIEMIEGIYADGKDLKQFIKDYMSFLLDINKYDILHSFDYLQLPGIYEERLHGLEPVWFECCKNLLPMIVKLNADIKWDSQPKVMIEAKLLGVCYEQGV